MASTYEKIASTTLSSTVASVTFSSISGAYTDLVVVMNPISSADNDSYPWLRFNGDTASNYSRTMIAGTGSVAQSDRSSNSTQGYFIYGNRVFTDASFNAIIHINNYSNTTTYKTFLARTGAASNRVESTVGLWRSTSAITSILFDLDTNSFVSGSTFTLYGIKAE